MNENLIVSIKNFNDEFVKRLHSSQTFNYVSSHNFINKITHCDKEILKTAFGDQAEKIVEFLNIIDIEHPDIQNCYDGIFSDSSDFIAVFDEIYAYAKFGKDNKFVKTMLFLHQLMSNYVYENYKILSKIDTPENNRCNIRFLSDKQKRENIRLQKKMQYIDLQSVCKKGMHHYNCHPSSFNNFIRFDKSLDEEIKKLKNKAKRFQDLGCSFLADEINENLQSYQDYVNQTYFGFNRITMSSASVILAKNLSFKCSVSSSYSSSNLESIRIFVSQDYFGNYIFDQENIEFKNNHKSYEYEPKIYPLHVFSDILTDQVKSIVDYLESFPDANNKPIFDFFGVIVPAINFPNYNRDGFFSFIDCKGLQRMYQDCSEAKFEFDKQLILNKHIAPIIVAEKDHKCYFVSYWS